MHRIAVCASAALFFAFSAIAGGQTKPAATPRTPWGHPDLQGRWTNATVTPLERPQDLGAKEFFTEAEAADSVNDPTTWTESWTPEAPRRKLDRLRYEASCHEGNRGLENNILKGARAADSPR